MSKTDKSAIKRPADPTWDLFTHNLETMRLWYAKQPGAGRELGHYTMMEMMAGHVHVCAQCAKDGIAWKPA